MSKLKVLVTGATGYIAQQILPALEQRYDVTLLDIRDKNRDGDIVEGINIANLLEDSLEDLKPYFSGVDIVVHMAYLRPTGNDHSSKYEGERLNVDMMQRVYQLSLDNGVKRVVAASTNQAAKWYETPFYDHQKDIVYPEDYPKPNNFYGWAKAAYESLGFLYACGSLGRKLEVIQIRIVVPREIIGKHFDNQSAQRYIRELAGYISVRDHQQLFCKSIETPAIEDEYGIPFHIFNGVSNNTRKFWSITNARKVVGYTPEDDSEIRFAKDIERLLK